MYLRMPWIHWNQYEQYHYGHLKQNSIDGIQHRKMFSAHTSLFCAMAVPALTFWVDRVWYLYWINCGDRGHSLSLYIYRPIDIGDSVGGHQRSQMLIGLATNVFYITAYSLHKGSVTLNGFLWDFFSLWHFGTLWGPQVLMDTATSRRIIDPYRPWLMADMRNMTDRKSRSKRGWATGTGLGTE